MFQDLIPLHALSFRRGARNHVKVLFDQCDMWLHVYIFAGTQVQQTESQVIMFPLPEERERLHDCLSLQVEGRSDPPPAAPAGWIRQMRPPDREPQHYYDNAVCICVRK